MKTYYKRDLKNTYMIIEEEEAKKAGAIISYDPNYRALLWKSEEDAIEKMRSMIPYADIMKISDEETALLTGNPDPKAAAEILLEQGVDCVVVTLGKDGALLKTKTIEVQAKGKERRELRKEPERFLRIRFDCFL